jgi:hypothetical protein
MTVNLMRERCQEAKSDSNTVQQSDAEEAKGDSNKVNVN